MTRLRAWAGRRARATAALEFGLLAPAMVMLMAWGADFGLMAHGRGVLVNAVAIGAQYAYLTGSTVAAANVKAMVEGSAGLTDTNGASQVTATVTGPACYCISSAAVPATLVSASCAATCSDGTAAGTYVAIAAVYSYAPLMPGLSSLTTTTMSESATVRVK